MSRIVSSLKSVLVVSSSWLVLSGCPKRHVEEEPTDAEPAKPSLFADEEAEKEIKAKSQPTEACTSPAWITLEEPCRGDDGAVFAVGKSASPALDPLAFGSGASKARMALSKAVGKIKGADLIARGAEVPDVLYCGKDVYALARVAIDPAENLDLPRCNNAQVYERSRGLEDCPDWTGRFAFREGAYFTAISAMRAPDAKTAESMARNKARAEINAMNALMESLEGKGPELDIISDDTATCQGASWVRLVMGPKAAPEPDEEAAPDNKGATPEAKPEEAKEPEEPEAKPEEEPKEPEEAVEKEPEEPKEPEEAEEKAEPEAPKEEAPKEEAE